MLQARCESDYPLWIFSSPLVPIVKSKLKTPKSVSKLDGVLQVELPAGLGK